MTDSNWEGWGEGAVNRGQRGEQAVKWSSQNFSKSALKLLQQGDKKNTTICVNVK